MSHPPVMLSLLLGALLVSRPYTGPEAAPLPEQATPPDVAASAEETRDVSQLRGPLGMLAWDPASRDVWVASPTGLVRVRADTGAVVKTLAPPVDDAFEEDILALSPDGNYIAAFTASEAVMVWDTRTGATTLRVTRPNWESVGYAAFSADSARIFTIWLSESARSEVARVEAFDVKTGRSLGTKRMREPSMLSDSPFMLLPVRHAGSHIYFDDLLMVASPRPIRACNDDDLPMAVAGELGFYEDDTVRTMHDCAVVRPRQTIIPVKAVELSMSTGARRVVYREGGKGERSFVLVDLERGVELARLGSMASDVGEFFALSPDGTWLAAAVHRKPEHLLVLWRAPAAGAAGRVITLRAQGR